MVSKQRLLLRAVTTPNRICRIVNVRPILALEIQRHSIDMALISGLAGHPDDSVHVWDRLEWKPSSSIRKIPDSILHELSERIQQQQQQEQQQEQQQQECIGGIIVGWPIQRDTGKLGAPCGRVLFTLESLLEQHPRAISLHRPLCFWPRTTISPTTATASCDGSTTASSPESPQYLLEEDAWGRCASYGRTVPHHRHLHQASKEQYAFDETLTAKDLWQDFFQVHWPALHRRRLQQQQQQLQQQQQQLLLQREEQKSSTSTTTRHVISPHGGGGRGRPPCANNLVTDWRGARSTLSSSYSTTPEQNQHMAGVLL